MDASKYGRIAEEPFLEATIPSLADPSLAPEGKHVMSVLVQAAPYRCATATGTTERDRLGDMVVKTLERYAPGPRRAWSTAREVITPVDMERDYGLTGGHVLARGARRWTSSSPGGRCWATRATASAPDGLYLRVRRASRRRASRAVRARTRPVRSSQDLKK